MKRLLLLFIPCILSAENLPTQNPILQSLQDRTRDVRTCNDNQANNLNNVTLDGNQVVGGDKVFENDVTFNGNNNYTGTSTFTGNVTVPSLTVTSESFVDGTTQTTAYNVLTSSYVKLVGGGGQDFGSVTWQNFSGASVSITTKGNTRIQFGYSVYAVNFAATMQCGTRIMVDSTDMSGGSYYGQAGGLQAVNEGITLSATGMTDILSTGTHTLQLQANSDNGTVTLGNSSTIYVWAQEIR